MISKHILCIGLLALAVNLLTVNGVSVDTCATQSTCINFDESGCTGGSRDVCIRSNPAASGCTLVSGTDTLAAVCAVSSTSPTGLAPILNGAGPSCFSFPGGMTATFAVSDDNAASGGAMSPLTVPRLTGGTISGSCAVPGTTLCPGATNTNTLWTFPVSACECTCPAWGEWSTCTNMCRRTRTRTCTGPADLSCGLQTDTGTCTSGLGSCTGCSCEPNFSSWSMCSSSCSGGTQTRKRACTSIVTGVTCEENVENQNCGSNTCFDPTRFGCMCGGWTGWTGCSASCGSGTSSRSRTCVTTPGVSFATCPTNIFPNNETRSCMATACVTTAAPTTTVVTQTPCSCTQWASMGSCSATCGMGVQMRTRTCTNCPSTQTTMDSIPCQLSPCTTTSAPTCTCMPWVRGQCSKTCGTGTAQRTRTCSAACPAGTFTTSQVTCRERSCGGRRRGCRRLKNRRRRRRCRINRRRRRN